MPIEMNSDSVSENMREIGGGNDFLRFGSAYRHPITVKVPLVASDAAGGVFAWANPEAGAIIVEKVLIDLTTIATGACTLDVGTTPTSAGTLSDNLIDGLDVHTAAGVFGVADGADANGKAQQRLAAGKWVTGSKASGASAGLVGSAFITYRLV